MTDNESPYVAMQDKNNRKIKQTSIHVIKQKLWNGTHNVYEQTMLNIVELQKFCIFMKITKKEMTIMQIQHFLEFVLKTDNDSKYLQSMVLLINCG